MSPTALEAGDQQLDLEMKECHQQMYSRQTIKGKKDYHTMISLITEKYLPFHEWKVQGDLTFFRVQRKKTVHPLPSLLMSQFLTSSNYTFQ